MSEEKETVRDNSLIQSIIDATKALTVDWNEVKFMQNSELLEDVDKNSMFVGLVTGEIYPADNDAYDGSNNPPIRELTSRERDILCRILDTIFELIRRKDWNALLQGYRTFTQDEIWRLKVVRAVIDPRREVE